MNQEIQFLLYSLPEESGQVQVVIKDETLWCTQKAMAALFDCSTDNIGVHLKNIYSEGELVREATAEKISVVQKDGEREVSRTPVFYNLDAIIAVGYRVNSAKATAEYDIFNRTQRIDSDFDKQLRRLEKDSRQ